MEEERATYVIQTRNTTNGPWQDFATYPLTNQDKQNAITRADEMHKRPPHWRYRVIRRLTSEWVIHHSD